MSFKKYLSLYYYQKFINNNDLFSIFFKFIELFIKFFLILFFPLILSLDVVGQVQVYLSLLFIFSVIISLGLNVLTLKNVSIDNNKLYEYLLFSTKLILNVSFIFFILLFFIYFILIDINIKYWLILLLNSTLYALISINSHALRGIGKTKSSIFYMGVLWPLLLILLLIFQKIFINEYINFNDICFYLLFVFIISYLSSIIHIYQNINFNYKNSIKTKININIYFYYESLLSNALLWLPIIYISLFYDDTTTGIISTKIRLCMSLIGGLTVVRFLISPIISKSFADNKIFLLKENFNKYKKIKLALAILMSIGVLIGIYFLSYFSDKNILTLYLLSTLFLICFSQFFGPVDSLLLFCNKEVIIFYMNIILIILILLSITIIYLLNLPIDLYLILFGTFQICYQFSMYLFAKFYKLI